MSDDEFELIFNIDAKSKVYLGELKLTLPSDFNEENFIRINKLFNKVKNKPYSINFINKILGDRFNYSTRTVSIYKCFCR